MPWDSAAKRRQLTAPMRHKGMYPTKQHFADKARLRDWWVAYDSWKALTAVPEHPLRHTRPQSKR